MLELFKIAWRNPREAVQYVNKHSFQAYWVVLFLAGFGNLIFSMMDDNGHISWLRIAIAVVIAIPSLWLSAVVAAFFTHFIAKFLFKGIGTFKQMRKGYYVSFLPYVVAAPVALIYIVIEKTAAFDLTAVIVITSLLTIVLSIVALVLEVIVISEVEGLSIGRSIGVLVVLMILLFVIITLVVMAIIAVAAIVGMNIDGM